jgi:hypothetical protein
MAIRSSTRTQPVPVSQAVAAERAIASVDERWALWHERGAAHDRAVRRKMTFAAPMLLIGAAIILSMLLR